MPSVGTHNRHTADTGALLRDERITGSAAEDKHPVAASSARHRSAAGRRLVERGKRIVHRRNIPDALVGLQSALGRLDAIRGLRHMGQGDEILEDHSPSITMIAIHAEVRR